MYNPEKNSQNSKEDFSLFLEWVEEEKQKLEEMRGRIEQRLKFFDTEETRLDLYKEKASQQSAECIRLMEMLEERLGQIYQDIIRHNQSKDEIEDRIELFEELHRKATQQLENWDIRDKVMH